MSVPAVRRSVEIDGEYSWTDAKRTAAFLLAEGRLGVEAIAAEVGVTRQTLWDWRQDLPFRVEVEQLRKQFDEEFYNHGFANKRIRIGKLIEHAERVEQKLKTRFNLGVAQEFRDTLKQLAIETGQWSYKVNVSGDIEVQQIQVREVVIELTEDKYREVVEAEFAPVERSMSPAQRIERTLVSTQPEPIPEPQQSDPAVIEARLAENRRLIAENEQRQQALNWSRLSDDWD